MTLDLKSDKKNKWSPDYGFLFKISWSEPIKKLKETQIREIINF